MNGNISFMLQSTGSKVWNFNSGNPINIANPNDFSWTLVSPTQLNVTDTSADEATVPQHNYTVMIRIRMATERASIRSSKTEPDDKMPAMSALGGKRTLAVLWQARL